jgi:Fe2+ transport system protein FeoA
MEVNLNTLNIGSVGYVTRVNGNHKIKSIMYNAGFRMGTKIVVLRVTPYTSNYLLDISGRVMSIKKGAISLIKVAI